MHRCLDCAAIIQLGQRMEGQAGARTRVPWAIIELLFCEIRNYWVIQASLCVGSEEGAWCYSLLKATWLIHPEHKNYFCKICIRWQQCSRQEWSEYSGIVTIIWGENPEHLLGRSRDGRCLVMQRAGARNHHLTFHNTGECSVVQPWSH